MLMHQNLERSDAIFILGSSDLCVAEWAADLYLQKYAPLIIVSGGIGKDKYFSREEAFEFKDIILGKGVPEEKILIEDKASNTGENILFTKELLNKKNINVQKVIAVQKPYMERRTYAAIKKLWPEVDVVVTSPKVSYEEYGDRDRFLHVMVGDLIRIREYPKLGFQIEQQIPEDVWQAGQELLDMGYNKYAL